MGTRTKSRERTTQSASTIKVGLYTTHSSKQACTELSLPQWYSRVRTPKDNAVLERFNRTIQEEFVEMAYAGIEDLKEFNDELTEWLVEYNSVRPHQALDYLTPLEYIDTYLNTKVLPMSSSHTVFCFTLWI